MRILPDTVRWLQAVLLGFGLFATSLIVRAAADTFVGNATAGPAMPEAMAGTSDQAVRYGYAVLLGVVLPAVIETPIVVCIVRRARRDTPSVSLVAALAGVFFLAWLLHGASAGSLGQASAFAAMAYAAWGWSRRLPRLYAYALPTLSHAVWNGCAVAIFAINDLRFG